MISITEKHRAANKLMAEIMERAKQETEEEKEIRRSKVCTKCTYAITNKGANGEYYFRYCDYVPMTGHMRPCAAVDCVESGVFRPLKGAKKGPRPFDFKRAT